MQKDALIVGGGISGITLALELDRSGISTALIEKGSSLGGLAASFCCKASEGCNKCFACVVDKRVAEIQNHPTIAIFTHTEPVGMKGEPGGYTVSLKRRMERIDLRASAIIIAAGIDPFDASQKVEYGYGRLKNVITARDLDEMLRLKGRLSRPSDGKLPRTVAFFQCVGSRDESIGNLYCSQVCCAYALRMASSIRHQYPEITVTFHYMDIQPAGSSFQRFLKSCQQDRGIRFVRNLPSKVYHSPGPDALRVRLIDPSREEVVEEPFDLIVLSVGMVPRKESTLLSRLFNLNLNEEGFFAPPPSGTGIFAAGACSGPKDIDRSITHSKSIALLVREYLKGGN